MRPHATACGFEVKTTTATRLDLRRHDVEQWDEMLLLYRRGYFVRYVVHWLPIRCDDSNRWEVFYPPDGPILRQGEGCSLDAFLLSAFPQQSPYSPPREPADNADERWPLHTDAVEPDGAPRDPTGGGTD